VPFSIKAAIKLIVGDMYTNREAQELVMSGQAYIENPTVMRLLWPYRLWGF
jgi:hypothetical protein